jgi:hypothetical protein
MMSTPGPVEDASAGELVERVSRDMAVLVRDELRLAAAETTAKAKKVGLGLGLLGTAGLVALFGTGALVAAAILGLATVVHPWLAAVIVGAALLAIAGVTALIGKRDVSAAAPPIPTEAVASVKTDINTLREGAHR